MHTTYILYSTILERYYVGSTSMSVEERLRRHNSNHSGYTGKTDDWKMILLTPTTKTSCLVYTGRRTIQMNYAFLLSMEELCLAQ